MYTRLPMWAGLEPQVISEATSFPNLHVIRGVARIDIGLNLDSNDEAGGLDNFTLTSAGYIGIASRYYSIPERENINGVSVIAPSFHSTYNYGLYTTAVQKVSSITDNRVIGGLFPYESRGDYISGSNYFSLIISGNYMDTSGNRSIQYYRIVLVDPADPDKRLDILRNHKYRVNILSVDGPGYGSENEARRGAPNNNIVYELSVHEEGKINHVVYSGNEYLGVSDVHSEHPGTAGTGEIKIKTNATGGWRRGSIVSDNSGSTTWLTFTAGSMGDANTVGTSSFTLRENLSDPRSAVVTFTAGALSMPVRILQNGTWYIYSDYQPGMMMRGDGDTYQVSVYGAVPKNLQVRAYSPDKDLIANYDDLIYNTGGGSIPQGSPEKQKLNIMGNASFPMAPRQVQFVYSTDAGATWVPFTEGPQGKGHFWLLDEDDFENGRTGCMVALYNMPDQYNWAEAMGIDPSFNNGFFYSTWQPEAPTTSSGTPVTRYWRANHGYQPTHQTGCADYYEEDYPEYARDKWRLPTMYELGEISKYHLYIGDVPFTEYYWSSSEDTGGSSFNTNSHRMELNGTKEITYTYVTKGSHYFSVRCVYGEPKVTPPPSP
ncbi:MAG: BACON domain-containing protein [Bacteroides sp.]|nr:BACON domain-containing protein [Bacteroides sp.]